MKSYAWTLSGSAIPASAGSMQREYEESGVIESEYVGEVVERIVNEEIEWGVLDDGEEFTITVRPVGGSK